MKRYKMWKEIEMFNQGGGGGQSMEPVSAWQAIVGASKQRFQSSCYEYIHRVKEINS